MRTKCPFNFNDRAKDQAIKKLASLQFLSISRGTSRTTQPRPKSVPTANTPDAIFEKIHLIIHSDIKNVYVIGQLPRELQNKENRPVTTYKLTNTFKNEILDYKDTLNSIYVEDKT